MELHQGRILTADLSERDVVDFQRNGYGLIQSVCSHESIREISKEFSSGRPERNALRIPTVRSFCQSDTVRAVISRILSRDAFATRATFFEKSEIANWKVTWHQDLTIAVQAKVEVEGFGLWSQKDGVVHVQPPAQLMAKVVALRLHLDENTEENGPLRVIPGSHAHGRLSSNEIDNWKTNEIVECLAPAGSALLMRPLLLHASSASKRPLHRRVLHIEFANFELPQALCWNERIPISV